MFQRPYHRIGESLPQFLAAAAATRSVRRTELHGGEANLLCNAANVHHLASVSDFTLWSIVQSQTILAPGIARSSPQTELCLVNALIGSADTRRSHRERRFPRKPRRTQRRSPSPARPLRYFPKSISGRQHKAIAPTKIVSSIRLQPFRTCGTTPRPYNKVTTAITKK